MIDTAKELNDRLRAIQEWIRHASSERCSPEEALSAIDQLVQNAQQFVSVQ